MNDVFHALNRGVDGRNIFLDSSDHVRFIHNLYEFNDTAPAVAPERRSNQNVRHRKSYIREKIVDIHGWCLMKNHYHLLLSERVENGLSLFLRKLNIGYAKYFNERYQRTGTLFQGRTKRVHVNRESHFLYILHYVHLNPLDYLRGAEKWRYRSHGEITNVQRALQYLDTYRWSSYLDYTGKKNFPSLITTSLFADSPGAYIRSVRDYLKDASSKEMGSFELE